MCDKCVLNLNLSPKNAPNNLRLDTNGILFHKDRIPLDEYFRSVYPDQDETMDVVVIHRDIAIRMHMLAILALGQAM